MAKVLSCIAGKSAQKVGTILPLSYQPLSSGQSSVTYSEYIKYDINAIIMLIHRT